MPSNVCELYLLVIPASEPLMRQNNDEIVASGEALRVAAQWLGTSAEADIQGSLFGAPESTNARPPLLGLGAKYLSHKEGANTLGLLSKRLRHNINQSLPQSGLNQDRGSTPTAGNFYKGQNKHALDKGRFAKHPAGVSRNKQREHSPDEDLEDDRSASIRAREFVGNSFKRLVAIGTPSTSKATSSGKGTEATDKQSKKRKHEHVVH